MLRIAQITIVPAKYHRVKVQVTVLKNPVTIPSGIPIIKPNPTMKDGAKAISGLLARENSAIKESSPKNSKGLLKKLMS